MYHIKTLTVKGECTNRHAIHYWPLSQIGRHTSSEITESCCHSPVKCTQELLQEYCHWYGRVLCQLSTHHLVDKTKTCGPSFAYFRKADQNLCKGRIHPYDHFLSWTQNSELSRTASLESEIAASKQQHIGWIDVTRHRIYGHDTFAILWV